MDCENCERLKELNKHQRRLIENLAKFRKLYFEIISLKPYLKSD